MRRFLAIAVLLSLSVPATTDAHEIIQRVSRGTGVVIELSYPDHSPFSYEQYEVYREGEEMPYQTGRTDALGRIVFLPDRQGGWRIRAFSESGHGIDVTIDAGPEGAMGTVGHSDSDRWSKIVLGLIIILGVFVVIFRVLRRRAM